MQPTPLPTDSLFNMIDRRSWPRFERRVRVLLLADDCALDEPFAGWIVDASRGGVRLCIRGDEIAEGAIIRIRKPVVVAGVPWIGVRVKNRVRKEEAWQLGCEFVRPTLQETATLFL